MGIWKTTNQASVAEQPLSFEFSSLDHSRTESPSEKEAQAVAEKIVNDAHAEAEAIRHQAFQQGQQDAELQLRIEAEARQQISAPILAKVAYAIEQVQTAACERAEQSVLPIAIAIARKVIARELSRDPNPSPELLNESLELMSGLESFQITVPPAAKDSVESAVAQISGENANTPAIHIAADSTLGSGEMVLRSEYGVIDQRSETRLQRILSELESA